MTTQDSAQNWAFAERGTADEIELGTVFAPKFSEDGTIPAIATDAKTGGVVMFAYMNKQSLSLSLQTGIAHYWSRSRNKLWLKGETSGNRQIIEEIRVDCDQDVIWLKVNVENAGASCHQGYHSCFYRAIDLEKDPTGQTLKFIEEAPLFDPSVIYKK